MKRFRNLIDVDAHLTACGYRRCYYNPDNYVHARYALRAYPTATYGGYLVQYVRCWGL